MLRVLRIRSTAGTEYLVPKYRFCRQKAEWTKASPANPNQALWMGLRR